MRGVTLIEVLVYSALLSLLIAGAVACLSLAASEGVDEGSGEGEREAAFVLAKAAYCIRTYDSCADTMRYDASLRAVVVREGDSSLRLTSGRVAVDAFSLQSYGCGREAAVTIESVRYSAMICTAP